MMMEFAGLRSAQLVFVPVSPSGLYGMRCVGWKRRVYWLAISATADPLGTPSPRQEMPDTPAPYAPRTVKEPSIEPSPLVEGVNSSKVSKLKCDPQAIVDLFNQTLPGLPHVAMLTKDRRAKIKARWDESEVHQDLEFWADFFALVSASTFLMGGESGRDGAKPFRATFDWLIKPSNFVKVVEGNYNA